ncbi:MAG TPA: hypothetical protein V6C84_14090 [Coleofasciculaceae cyanobacterium]|jgi:hypothetical protein
MPQNPDFDNSAAETPVISYRDRLNHWAIVRLLPNTQQSIVARFRSRSDAEGHLRFLRNSMPESNFLLSFDSPKNIEGISG